MLGIVGYIPRGPSLRLLLTSGANPAIVTNDGSSSGSELCLQADEIPGEAASCMKTHEYCGYSWYTGYDVCLGGSPDKRTIDIAQEVSKQDVIGVFRPESVWMPRRRVWMGSGRYRGWALSSYTAS